MTDPEIVYSASGPSGNDRRLAARLGEIGLELEQERSALPSDTLHNTVSMAFKEAQAAIERARAVLLGTD